MKKAFYLFIIICFFVTSAQAQTLINLFDVSGSIAECGDAFEKNIRIIDKLIDTLDKNDRFILMVYRSHDKPYTIVDEPLPPRRGGRKKYIIAARAKIKEQVAAKFDKLLKDAEALKRSGPGTDIIGALRQVGLLVDDYPTMNHPIVLHHFSDGVITTGIGNFSAQNYKRYLKTLEKHLADANIPLEKIDDIHWFGGTCYTGTGLTLSESADLLSAVKEMWLAKLSQVVKNVTYLNHY